MAFEYNIINNFDLFERLNSTIIITIINSNHRLNDNGLFYKYIYKNEMLFVKTIIKLNERKNDILLLLLLLYDDSNT